MSGGTFVDVRVGRLGSAGAHVDYIARPDALREPHVLTPDAPLFVRRLPPYVLRGVEDADDLRACLRTYAEIEERDEIARYRGDGQCRSHYRITMSWGAGEAPTHAQAQRMSDELLEKHFPHSPVIGAIHSNTDNVHASLYIGARQTDGKKLVLRQNYLRIDESWNRIYCRETGRDPQEHLAKKAETMAARRAGRPRPERFARYRAVPIHPAAQYAADLVGAVQRMEALDRIIKSDPSSPPADAARTELRTFGNQGSTRAKRKQMGEAMIVLGEDPDLRAQVRRLVGAELFARADEIVRALEQTMVGKGLRRSGWSR